MEKMFNPFLEGSECEETNVSYIMDKALNGSNDQKAVFRFFQYLLTVEDNSIYNDLNSGLKDILGANDYNLIKALYLDSYNKEAKVFEPRYAYFDERSDVGRVFRAFVTIYHHLPHLRMIANTR